MTLAHPGLLSAISLTDGGTPTLTLDTAELTRDDAVLTLIDTPYALVVGDTAANLQAELLLPNSPLLSHLAAITGITATDSGSITMGADQVTRANIDDGAGSVLGKMTGETLVVTDVRAADVATILALPVAPSYITVVDTASGIAADLASGASQLVASRADISSITISDGGTVHLTEAQVLAAGVDDGAGSVLSLAVGLTLDVTDVATADIATVAALPVAPASIEVSDTAAGIQADLASGSSGILAQLGLIGGIDVTDSGTITLTASQATAAGVDDSAGSAFAKMTGGMLAVTGVSVAQLDAVANLQVPPVSILMSDTAAHIQGDLTGGASAILAHLTLIDGITVSDAGSISLTETQVLAAHVDDGAGSVFSLVSGGSLTVTDVLAADVATDRRSAVRPGAHPGQRQRGGYRRGPGFARLAVAGEPGGDRHDRGERRRHRAADRGGDPGPRRRCGARQAHRQRGRHGRAGERDRHGARPRRAPDQHRRRGQREQHRGGPGLRLVAHPGAPGADQRDHRAVRQHQPDRRRGDRRRRG